MTKRPKIIVRVGDYNGHKNVLFMMFADDFRLTMCAKNYTQVTTGEYDRKQKRFFGDDGGRYKVFNDWSVRAEK